LNIKLAAGNYQKIDVILSSLIKQELLNYGKLIPIADFGRVSVED
jgi:hypothetical protein